MCRRWALGIALTSLVGKAIGQHRLDRAWRITRLTVAMTMSYMGLLSVIFLIWRHPLIALINDDPEVVAVGGKVMLCLVVFQLFDGLAIILNGALRERATPGGPRWSIPFRTGW